MISRAAHVKQTFGTCLNKDHGKLISILAMILWMNIFVTSASLWDVVGKDDFGWALVTSQVFPTMLNDIFFSQGMALFENDKCIRTFTPFLIWTCNDGTIGSHESLSVMNKSNLIPATYHSDTASSCTMTFSTSIELIFSPPETTTSLERSTISTEPSTCRTPKSPVQNTP